jgi:hypothetical protein
MSCNEGTIQQQQQQQGLRLHSYSNSLSKAVGLLATLQPHSLVHVELDLEFANTDRTALSAALARLSNLQHLCMREMRDASLWRSLPTLAQLRWLTALELGGYWPRCVWDHHHPAALKDPASVALQQLLSQPLPLRWLVLECANGRYLPVLEMLHLTNLTKLGTSSCWMPWESVLPAQLQQLAFISRDYAESLEPVTRQQLQQLQHLRLHVDFAQQQPLLQLAQLPALQHLELVYDSNNKGGESAIPAAAATESAWALLPQLRALVIQASYTYARVPESMAKVVQREEEWAAIVAGAAASSTIVKLELHALSIGHCLCSDCCSPPLSDDDEDVFETPLHELVARVSTVDVCASLARLPSLQHLSIQCGYGLGLGCDDALALTVLTALTCLKVFGPQIGRGYGQVTVSTAAATALACNLKQLQHLTLNSCGIHLSSAVDDLEWMGCLGAIGRLTQLTYLDLCYNGVATLQQLMQLTGLSRLTPELDHRGIRVLPCVSDELRREDWDDFWAAWQSQQ